MVASGILQIDEQGLIWKVQKKHKEWDGYRDCKPRLLGHDNHGYLRIGIRDEDGSNLKAFAHRLVYLHFYGDILEEMQVNHKNGVIHDNRPENLELMTASQQMIHAVEVLGRRVGNRTHKARHWKIEKSLHAKICKSSKSIKELAERFGVTATRIRQIRQGV